MNSTWVLVLGAEAPVPRFPFDLRRQRYFCESKHRGAPCSLKVHQLELNRGLGLLWSANTQRNEEHHPRAPSGPRVTLRGPQPT
jgi:hypothetical protein